MGQCNGKSPSRSQADELAVIQPRDPATVKVSGESNPPQWGPNVYVFSPGDPTISEVVNRAYGVNGGDCNKGEWSDDRYAFLFKPGQYTENVPVGYYTSVAGLGMSPDDVQFTGEKGVYCDEGCSDPSRGALCTFWRSAENFKTQGGMVWAVSQASPLRRVHVTQDLVLTENGGCASGGFLADSVVEGKLGAGGQQQWISRNVKMGSWEGFVWNYVFVGCEGAPSEESNSNLTVVDQTPVIAEKPFITVDSSSGSDKFSLQVPAVRNKSNGPSWLVEDSGARQIDFENVYVTRVDDTASIINAKLASSRIDAVVITPGIYHLDQPLKLVRDNQVLLGLGMATLVSTSGNPLISVAKNLGGIRVAGLLLQAGPQNSPTLLDWGASAPDTAVSVLQDIFARVGGPSGDDVQTDKMVHIKGCNVIGDNLWLWRADHYNGGETYDSKFPCQNGLIVEGDDVTMYGLAVEHTLADLVVWSGNRGKTYFYQCELPYDVSSFNYCGYKVNDDVKAHEGYGLGVYHYFRDHPVVVASGIQCSPTLLHSFEHSLTVHLNGSGTIQHVINEVGEATYSGQQVARVKLVSAASKEAITYVPKR